MIYLVQCYIGPTFTNEWFATKAEAKDASKVWLEMDHEVKIFKIRAKLGPDLLNAAGDHEMNIRECEAVTSMEEVR